ncbi:unnamed protein product [Lampetra planeri]
MGDTGSEGSEAPRCQPRCRCGFWGSTKTMNLCSKCFAGSTASEEATGAAPSSLPAPSSRLLAPVAEIALISSAELERVSPPREPQPAPSREPEAGSSTSMSPSSRSTNQDSRGCDSPAKKTCGDKDEDEEEKGRAKQKNKRRCFTCRARLELVQQELGLCRCGFVFCSLHRLPEQHACTYDHMGHGRQEALQKMVKLDKKVGRSFHRIGEECC